MSRRGALLLAAGGFALLSPPATRPPAPRVVPTPSLRPRLEALLAARADALLRRDEAALLAGVTPAAAAEARTLLERLAEVPLAELTYRLTGYGEPSAGTAIEASAGEASAGSVPGPSAVPPPGLRVTAAVELRYRLTGVDAYPAVLTRTVEFAEAGQGWRVASEGAAGPVALWDLGAVKVAKGARSLVLGLGEVAPAAGLADAAVPAVSELWGQEWAGRLLLEIPSSEAQFAQLLGVRAADYQGIAAVTTAATGAPEHAAADRVVVNPEAYAELTELGRHVVTTHEATHVATRAATKAWTPLWLSEGAADYTAYRRTGRTPRQIAPELAHDVQAGKLPAALPADADFTAGGAGIAQAYEQGWAACRLIADRYGEPALTSFYRAVGAAGPTGGRDPWLDGLLRSHLGLGLDAFVAAWRAELTTMFGRAT
ncbi:hypothetical protein CFP65_1925 [Kitasatospora sp. MMS16-BH015]|nr:hypothetical protein CFP65_1925 [Kitasatospora sp. MMS16-BH015]